jgi:hypothetical protein
MRPCAPPLAASLAAALTLAACSDDPAPTLGAESVATNEAAIEAELIKLTKEVTLARREESGDRLVRRFNQSKTVACLDGELVVGTLPADLAIGLFATPRSYPAKLRFANATELDDREKDLRGLSIKVADVPGAVSVDGGTGIQDFTLNNYPALFAGTPDDFLSFVQATAKGRTWAYFLTHWGSLSIVLRARSNPDSPFAERYYSTTPFLFGPTAFKYSVRACDTPKPTTVPEGPDYLRDALAKNLESGPVCLAFMVQLQTDAESMPIEDAAEIWDEDVSPYRKVAELRIPPQEFRDEAHMSTCEALSFNPWNGLSAHRPLGGINRVRKTLYEELAKFRANENGF